MTPPWAYEPLGDEDAVDWFAVVREGDTERTFAAKTYRRAELLCELLNAIEACESDSIVISPVTTVFDYRG